MLYSGLPVDVRILHPLKGRCAGLATRFWRTISIGSKNTKHCVSYIRCIACYRISPNFTIMKKSRLTLLATLVILAAGALWFVRPYGSFAFATSEAQKPSPEAVPVTAVAAKVQDVPVELH